MLVLLTVFLGVGYLWLDANLSEGVLFLSPHLFYPRGFIEVSGSEPSDGLRSISPPGLLSTLRVQIENVIPICVPWLILSFFLPPPYLLLCNGWSERLWEHLLSDTSHVEWCDIVGKLLSLFAFHVQWKMSLS